MADEETKAKKDNDKPAFEFEEEEPSITKHNLSGLKYTVTTGRMPLKNDLGEIQAQVFYIAYTLDNADVLDRPVMFTFNGGPGSPAIWLHMGALGPRRAPLTPDGQLPAPPYNLVDNPDTWLQFTDLVFIDPVGTGYSRGKDEETSKEYWSIEGDVKGVGEFIRMYLNRNDRWRSPLYLAGESYGTTRSAGLAGHLISEGIAFNGIVLVSSILNFQTAGFSTGNDLAYKLFLPTYTATAFYHGRLPWAKSLPDALAQSEKFALSDYAAALNKGDDLAGEERAAAIKELARLTGLSEEYVDRCDLRVKQPMFCKELLRDDRRTVGRLDSRIKGIDPFHRGEGESMNSDPSMSMLMPPYTAAFNDYVRRELNYRSDLKYQIFGGIGPWNWGGNKREGFPDTGDALRDALHKNPYMKVFVASGYFDLATPYFATEYTLRHMGLDPEVRGNFEVGYYEAGHMMYVHEDYLKKLHADIKQFVAKTKGR
ncbi:MAG: hypothetical protein KF812_07120 [Fimbriimonadaceae bacterium]|nr:hypothetical protein [Fimbriimonadaceae bacterium]